MSSDHEHVYRAIPGAGYRCIKCDRPTVTRPPKEQMASYQEAVTSWKRRTTELPQHHDTIMHIEAGGFGFHVDGCPACEAKKSSDT